MHSARRPWFTPLTAPLLSRLAPVSLHGMKRAPRISQEKDTQPWTQDLLPEGSSHLYQGVGLLVASPSREASAHREGSEETDNLLDQPHLVATDHSVPMTHGLRTQRVGPVLPSSAQRLREVDSSELVH